MSRLRFGRHNPAVTRPPTPARSRRPVARFALLLGLLATGCGEPEVGGSGRLVAHEEGAPAKHVVVSGTDYEMGWHHGRLLRDEVRALVPAWIQATFRTGRSAEDARVLEDACRMYAGLMKAMLPDSVKEELRGLAAGSGVKADDLFLLEAARDGLAMHPGAARRIEASLTMPPSAADGVWVSYSSPGSASERPWLVVERHPVGRAATLCLTWPGGLGAFAGLSSKGLLAAHGEVEADVERQSLRGVPFAVGFRTALETAATTDAFEAALPRTTAHRVVARAADGRRTWSVRAMTAERVSVPEAESHTWDLGGPAYGPDGKPVPPRETASLSVPGSWQVRPTGLSTLGERAGKGVHVAYGWFASVPPE
jgi:hypothetical protein